MILKNLLILDKFGKKLNKNILSKGKENMIYMSRITCLYLYDPDLIFCLWIALGLQCYVIYGS